MDEKRRRELEAVIADMRQGMARADRSPEEAVPADEALEDRLALARRIGRLYLSFSRVLLERLGEEEGKAAILEAMRDYSLHCAEARKEGMVDLPRRGVHARQEVAQVDGEFRLRCHGCGIQQDLVIALGGLGQEPAESLTTQQFHGTRRHRSGAKDVQRRDIRLHHGGIERRIPHKNVG